MRFLKNALVLVLVLVLLEGLKTGISYFSFPNAYFISTVLACGQFLLLLLFSLYFILRKILPARLRRRTVILIALLVLSAGEGLFAYWLHNPNSIPRPMRESFQYYYHYYNRRIIQYQTNAAVYDSALFYRLRPHARIVFSNPEFSDSFSINSVGLRDDELSLNAPRVVVLGDSYAMGWGVSQQQAFPQVLQRKSGIRVLSAAVSSYGTAREMKLLSQLDISAAKFVVIQYCANDREENETFVQNGYKLPVSGDSIFHALQSGHALSRAYFPGKHLLTIGPIFIKMTLNRIRPLFRMEEPVSRPFTEGEKHARAFLDNLLHANITWGETKILVTMVDSYQQTSDEFLDSITKLLGETPYKDMLGNRMSVLSVKKYLPASDYYSLDPHIKPSGHEKIADAIWNWIQENQ